MNKVDLLIKAISELESPKWQKLSMWCKEVGISQKHAKGVYKTCISKPPGSVWMIDVHMANEILERGRLVSDW